MHACVKVSLSMKCQQPRNCSSHQASCPFRFFGGSSQNSPRSATLGGHGKRHQVKQEDKFKLSLPNIQTYKAATARGPQLNLPLGSRVARRGNHHREPQCVKKNGWSHVKCGISSSWRGSVAHRFLRRRKMNEGAVPEFAVVGLVAMPHTAAAQNSNTAQSRFKLF